MIGFRTNRNETFLLQDGKWSGPSTSVVDYLNAFFDPEFYPEQTASLDFPAGATVVRAAGKNMSATDLVGIIPVESEPDVKH